MTKLSNAADEDHWSGSRFPHLPKPQPTNAAPPKRKWVGLTDEDRMSCEQSAKGNYFALCTAIEAKLKEKNT